MQTKDRIIEVVIEYIKQDRNISEVSLAEIARKADIGKSTVYEYFENKDQLICDTYLYMLESYEHILFKELTHQTYKEAFIEQIKRILDAMKDAKNLVETIFSQQTQVIYKNDLSIDKKLQEIKQKMETRFLNIFSLGVKDGLIEASTKDSDLRGYVIQALITGLLFQYVNEQMGISEQQLLELIYDEVLKTFK